MGCLLLGMAGARLNYDPAWRRIPGAAPPCASAWKPEAEVFRGNRETWMVAIGAILRREATPRTP